MIILIVSITSNYLPSTKPPPTFRIIIISLTISIPIPILILIEILNLYMIQIKNSYSNPETYIYDLCLIKLFSTELVL